MLTSHLFAGMGMEDPIPTFSYAVTQLANQFSNLAYLHAVEPRVSSAADRVVKEGEVSRDTLSVSNDRC